MSPQNRENLIKTKRNCLGIKTNRTGGTLSVQGTL